MLQLGEGKYKEEQEKIYFSHMFSRHTSNWYPNKYKSIGSILHYWYVYDELFIVEHIIIGDGKIYYPDENTLIANYIWNEELQMPIFNSELNFRDINDKQKIYLKYIKEV